MNHIKCFEDLIHTVLIFIHRANCPHVVVFRRDAVLSWEGAQRCNSLQSHELLRELVLDEDATLWRAEVGAALSQRLAVEGLMNDADSWSTIDSNSDHACDVIQMALGEALGAIERVNPDDHLLLEELVGELIVVVVRFRGRHPVYLLHLLQVLAFHWYL